MAENEDPRALQEFLQNLQALNETRSKNQITLYQPYPKQRQFHAMGADKDERLLSAGNQLGKTWAGSYEAAYHATGMYPDWWEGRRWDRPTKGWVGGESSTVVRDTSQTLLLGDLSEGMGCVPNQKPGRKAIEKRFLPGPDAVKPTDVKTDLQKRIAAIKSQKRRQAMDKTDG